MIVHGPVKGIVAGFGDPPGKALNLAIADLGLQGVDAAFVEQGAGYQAGKEHRHQVFEHGAAPGEQRPAPAGRHQQPAQVKPMFSFHLAQGHRHQAGKAGFAGHQVVPGPGKPARPLVKADVEQTPFLVVQGAKVHGLCHGPAALPLGAAHIPRQLLQRRRHRQQAGGQVAAIHRGYIPGRQYPPVPQAVPIIEMPPPGLQALQGIQHVPDPPAQLFPRQEPQIHGAYAGYHPHADVRRGGIGHHRAGRRLLIIVRRQPAGLRPGKPIEKGPRPPGDIQQQFPGPGR